MREFQVGLREPKIDYVAALIKISPDLSLEVLNSHTKPLERPWIVRKKGTEKERIMTATSFASFGSSRSALQRIGFMSRTFRGSHKDEGKQSSISPSAFMHQRKDSIEEKVEEEEVRPE